MRPNHAGLIICLLLAVVTGLILFVESKRPIYVEITMNEITEEMCNAEANAQKNNEEKKSHKEKAPHPLSKDYNKKEEKGDLR